VPKAEQEIGFLANSAKKEGGGGKDVELFLLCMWMKIAIKKKEKNMNKTFLFLG